MRDRIAASISANPASGTGAGTVLRAAGVNGAVTTFSRVRSCSVLSVGIVVGHDTGSPLERLFIRQVS
jgi:hypothetical protein